MNSSRKKLKFDSKLNSAIKKYIHKNYIFLQKNNNNCFSIKKFISRLKKYYLVFLKRGYE